MTSSLQCTGGLGHRTVYRLDSLEHHRTLCDTGDLDTHTKTAKIKLPTVIDEFVDKFAGVSLVKEKAVLLRGHDQKTTCLLMLQSIIHTYKVFDS